MLGANTEIAAAVPTLVRLSSSSRRHKPIPIGSLLTVIGSKPGTPIYLKSSAVSGAHAALINLENVVYIRDLCSRTGLFVNDKPVREARLLHADVVRIGAFRFRFSDVAVLRRSRDSLKTPPALLRAPGAAEPVTVHNRLFLIGRREGADLVLPDKQVSSAHAMILDAGGRRVLCDLHSRYGTTVNGSRVAIRELTPGDTIQIGNAALEYHTDPAAIAAARSADGTSSGVLHDLTERPERPVTIVPPAPSLTDRLGGDVLARRNRVVAPPEPKLKPEIVEPVDDAPTPIAEAPKPETAPAPTAPAPATATAPATAPARPKRKRSDENDTPPLLKRSSELLEARAADLFSDHVVSEGDIQHDDEISDPSGPQPTIARAEGPSTAARSSEARVEPTVENVPLHPLTLEGKTSPQRDFVIADDEASLGSDGEMENDSLLDGWDQPDAAGAAAGHSPADILPNVQQDAEPLPIGALPVDDISSGLFAETNTELSMFLDDYVKPAGNVSSDGAASGRAATAKPSARKSAKKPARRWAALIIVLTILLLIVAGAAAAVWFLPGLRARFL